MSLNSSFETLDATLPSPAIPESGEHRAPARSNGRGTTGPVLVRTNAIVRAAIAEDPSRIGLFETARIAARQVFCEPGQSMTHVYFPTTCSASMVGPLRGGSTVEVGTVGPEGIIGLAVFLGSGAPSMRIIAQLPGEAQRMPVAEFRTLVAESKAVSRALLAYTEMFLLLVSQTAVCNAAHLLDERCARWLLMTHDRAGSDEFPLTHEFLAFMLGVRRAGVTVAVGNLQRAGWIRYGRGHVAVRNRTGLEGASCECYDLVRSHMARIKHQWTNGSSEQRHAEQTVA